jgi:hypothetical protein
LTLRVSAFPLCCGIAVVNGFGNDPRHAHRDRRDGAPTMAQIEDFLRRAAEDAETGEGLMRNAGVGRIGMLLAAVNTPQKAFMAPIFRRLGWRRAGRCNNIHGDGQSDIFLYRKVIAEANDQE